MVQVSEEGVIKSRYVEEGQKVETGDLLFTIDPIEAKTTYEQALQRLASLKTQKSVFLQRYWGKNLFSLMI